MIKEIRNQIITTVKTVSSLGNRVYGYPKAEIEEYPSAFVLYRSTTPEEFTQQNIKMKYKFDIQLYQELKQTGISTAEDDFLDLIDEVETALYGDLDLGGANSPGLYQYSAVLSIDGTVVASEGRLRIATISLEVQTTKAKSV